MESPVIGRASQLAAIDRFLDALTDGSAVLVFEAEPGMGKTTLIRAGMAEASRRGAHVLACAGSGSETRLAYAALADLLSDVRGDVVERLPVPQRTALDAALLRSSPVVAADVDRRAVATAALGVLRALVETSAVVLAIDDLQWLDGRSVKVIEFCTRRLPRGVGLIASRRLGEDGAWSAPMPR